MVATDKERLLDAITRRPDPGWGLDEDDELCFPALFDLVEKYYSANFLRMLVKQLEKKKTYYYRPNRFVMYIKERLGE